MDPDPRNELMAYLLLIIEPRGQREARSEEQGRAAYAEMLAYVLI
jgi:hypothetical protein